MDASDHGDASRVHLLGIGGTGMSSLALHLRHEGHRVSGSDRSESTNLELLRRAGVEVSLDEGELPPDLDRIIVSSAIPSSHSGLVAARERGISVVHRSEELSRVFNGRRGIAVAGSHGKTTTSALLTHILVA